MSSYKIKIILGLILIFVLIVVFVLFSDSGSDTPDTGSDTPDSYLCNGNTCVGRKLEAVKENPESGYYLSGVDDSEKYNIFLYQINYVVGEMKYYKLVVGMGENDKSFQPSEKYKYDNDGKTLPPEKIKEWVGFDIAHKPTTELVDIKVYKDGDYYYVNINI